MAAEPFKFDGVLEPWKRGQILRFCQSSALDVGCNSGELVMYLNQKQIHAQGIDKDAGLIEQARKNNPGIEFHCGSELSKFADNQFETVIAWNVLEHIAEDDCALREMIRIASKNVIASVPKEDKISLPDSRVTYRPYVDPTHVHYYTHEHLLSMIANIGDYGVYIEDTTRIRPALAYAKIGVPRWLCAAIDTVLWSLAGDREPFHANLMFVVNVCGKNNRIGLAAV